jgi:hypothetical protein
MRWGARLGQAVLRWGNSLRDFQLQSNKGLKVSESARKLHS